MLYSTRLGDCSFRMTEEFVDEQRRFGTGMVFFYFVYLFYSLFLFFAFLPCFPVHPSSKHVQTSISRLMLPVSKADNGVTVRCVAEHAALEKPLEDTLGQFTAY